LALTSWQKGCPETAQFLCQKNPNNMFIADLYQIMNEKLISWPDDQQPAHAYSMHKAATQSANTSIQLYKFWIP
jgi:hypothetical protein